jgi:hypothetical protein
MAARPREFRWYAQHRHWFFEGGAFPVVVLTPLTVLLALVSPELAFVSGAWAVIWIFTSAGDWIDRWRAVVEVRVPTRDGQLWLRQRYGRTRTFPLDALTAVRPLQIGAVSWVMVEPGQGDERTEEDVLVLRLQLGSAVYTTYNTPHTAAAMMPLVAALQRACPGMVVAATEERRPRYVDVERGMSPG